MEWLVLLAIIVANPIISTILAVVLICFLISAWQDFRDAANKWVEKINGKV